MSFSRRVALTFFVIIIALALAGFDRESMTFSRSDRRSGQALRAARESVAIIDTFLRTGDLDALWTALDRVGDALVPWPAGDMAQRNAIALAFRESFPAFRLRLAGWTPSENVFAALLNSTGAEATLPTWLTTNVVQVHPETSVRLVDLRDDGSLALAGSAPDFRLMAAPAPPIGARFALQAPFRLHLARLSLEPGSRGVRSLAVPGPSLIAPEAETMRVTGQGALVLLRSGNRAWQPLAPGESLSIEPGDLLVVTSGAAILQTTSTAHARLILATVVSSANGPEPYPDGGRQIATDLHAILASLESEPISAWFGTVASLSQTDLLEPQGFASFEPIWVVLPAGTCAVVDGRFAPTLVAELFRSNARIDAHGARTALLNDSNGVALMLVLRLVAGA